MARIKRLRQKEAKGFEIISRQYKRIKPDPPAFADFLRKAHTLKAETGRFVIFELKQ